MYGNRMADIAGRIYPSRVGSLGTDVLAAGGGVRMTSLDAWQMSSFRPT